jgi:hypothetical protein
VNSFKEFCLSRTSATCSKKAGSTQTSPFEIMIKDVIYLLDRDMSMH